MDDLQIPPTEAEVADLCSLPIVGGIVRRLAFQRDTLAARIRELEAPLVWTDATPTAPGVYLWRYDSMSPIDNWEIVEACLDNKFGIVRRRGSFSYAFPDGQFAGPISMPVEPKEERK